MVHYSLFDVIIGLCSFTILLLTEIVTVIIFLKILKFSANHYIFNKLAGYTVKIYIYVFKIIKKMHDYNDNYLHIPIYIFTN